MKLFQILAHIGLIVLLITLLLSRAKRGLSTGVFILWGSLFLLSGIAILVPQITNTAAHILGIGRGADLIFYLGMLVMGAGFFATYLRVCKLERSITMLTRTLALRQPTLKEHAQSPEE